MVLGRSLCGVLSFVLGAERPMWGAALPVCGATLLLRGFSAAAGAEAELAPLGDVPEVSDVSGEADVDAAALPGPLVTLAGCDDCPALP